MKLLQNLAVDWSTGSTGCYDAVSLARLQGTLKYDFKAVATGNCDLCLNLPIANEFRDQLILETLRADAHSLGKLMADHTQVGIGQAAGPVQTIDNVCLSARSRLHSSLQCSKRLLVSMLGHSRVWHAFVSVLHSSATSKLSKASQDRRHMKLLGSMRVVQAICQPTEFHTHIFLQDILLGLERQPLGLRKICAHCRLTGGLCCHASAFHV